MPLSCLLGTGHKSHTEMLTTCMSNKILRTEMARAVEGKQSEIKGRSFSLNSLLKININKHLAVNFTV